MTPEEAQAFLEAARRYGEKAYTLFAVALNLGLRISEALNLDRASFRNLASNQIYVRSLKEGPGQAEDIIYVDDASRQFLSRYLAKLPKGQKYLFPLQETGKPIYRVKAWRLFKEIAKKARLNKLYSPHALRHSRGVLLWENTKDLQFVRTQLRHRSISSTSIYIHMSPQTQREFVERVKPLY